MKVISITNRKGGASKTTTTVSVGASFARDGKKVLLIDFDPQASLTIGLLGEWQAKSLPADATGAALFGDGFVSPDRIIVPTRFAGLSVLPGSPALDDYNLSRSGEDGGREFVLRDFLAEVGGDFDRVLIDGAPNLYFLSRCALAAADFVLTPTIADADGTAAIPFVNQEVARIQARTNPALVQLGIVLGDHYPKSASHIAYAESLRLDFPSLVFDSFFPHAAAIKEARKAEMPIPFYKPKCLAAKAVAAVVQEIEARIGKAASGERRAAA